MNCKFCNAEMDENHKFCPFCGKDQTEQPVVQEPAEMVTPEDTQEKEIFATEVDAQEVQVETQEEPQEEPKKEIQNTSSNSRWPLALGITGAVLGLLALAVALLLAFGVDFKALLPQKETEPTVATQLGSGASVSEEVAIADKDVVVAKMGDKVLTNTQLQIYYHMQLIDLLNYYGSYLSEIGLDTEQPLSEQPCFYDETKSWEEYLIEKAIETWQNYQAIGLLAEEAGFGLEGDWLESYNHDLPETLSENAASGGYASVDEMLADIVGPTCSEAAYMEYVKLAYIGNAYYASLQEELTPMASEVEAYFTANEAAFANNGITLTSGNVAAVRHILLCPENPITNEETYETTYAQEDWDNCQKAAEDLLAQWKNGDATEASFMALVEEHTEDTGSMTTGGLYEGITPTSSYVEPFRTWAVDITRVPGETGIVKTEFGYHIMYYVSGEPEWFVEAETQLLADRMTEKTNAAEAKWPMEADHSKISLTAPNLGV